MIGIGAMIGMLGENSEAVAAYHSSMNKTIGVVLIRDDQLCFDFTDGSKLVASDEGQSCCEHRYMHTDDDLTHYSGATLLRIELRDAPSEPDEYGEHEVQFLVVDTSKGSFTVASHNEHNGYYGGFYICLRAIAAAGDA